MPQKQDDFHCIIIHRKVILIDGVKSHLTDRKVSFNTLEFNQRSRFLETTKLRGCTRPNEVNQKAWLLGKMLSSVVLLFSFLFRS